MTTPVTTGTVPVNGLQMYYEIHGEGPAAGAAARRVLGDRHSFGALLPGLAGARQVIAIELQAHGRTADIDRPLRIEHMAETSPRRSSSWSSSGPTSSATAWAPRGPARRDPPPEVVRKLVSCRRATRERHPPRPDGRAWRDDPRDDVRVALARGVHAHRAASRRLRPAVRQEGRDGSGYQDLPARTSGDRGADAPDDRRLRSHRRSTRWRCSACSAAASSATCHPACRLRSSR